MNKAKRDKLRQARAYLENACSVIETVSEQESDSLSNAPENLQSSEKYERMEEVIDILDSALDEINAAIENIDNAIA